MKAEELDKLIKSIIPNEANFKYCAEKGIINGTLYFDIKKVAEAYHQHRVNAISDDNLYYEWCTKGLKRYPTGSVNATALVDFVKWFKEQLLKQ